MVCINGAAAHKARKGDLVIIASFSEMTEDEARAWTPRCVFVDAQNRPVELARRARRAGGGDRRLAVTRQLAAARVAQ